MTAKDSVLRALRAAGQPICDDCLAPLTTAAQRRHANAVCRELAAMSAIARAHGVCGRCHCRKLVNEHVAGHRTTAPTVEGRAQRPVLLTRTGGSTAPFEERDVQERLVAWLRAQGYRIIRTADTSSKEHGRDVVARAPSGRELWVTAKGYRKKTPSTSPNAQARHSVEAALLDLLLWRGEGNCDADLAIALPRGRTTYRNLMSRLGWARSALPFTVLWVADDGTVTPELPTDQ